MSDRIEQRTTGGSGAIHAAKQSGTIISVVVVGVVALIGTLIVAEINSALPTISNSQLSSSKTGLVDGVANANLHINSLDVLHHYDTEIKLSMTSLFPMSVHVD